MDDTGRNIESRLSWGGTASLSYISWVLIVLTYLQHDIQGKSAKILLRVLATVVLGIDL